MAGRYSDTVYDRNAPGAGDPYVAYSSNEERLVSQALASQTAVDRDAVRALQPAGRGPLFPPRFIGPRTEPTLDDVVVVDRRYPDSSAQFSGTSGGYSGTSVPSIGWW